MSTDCAIKDEYVGRHPILVETAGKLQTYLNELISELPRIDSVSARAKDPDRYCAKAVKVDESGKLRYTNPRYSIQDQIGARINVLYLSDVEHVRAHVVKFIRHIEEAPKSPTDDAAFGYFGFHFIFQTPDERRSQI
jgi:putative GTP pyrophosphokinase